MPPLAVAVKIPIRGAAGLPAGYLVWRQEMRVLPEAASGGILRLPLCTPIGLACQSSDVPVPLLSAPGRAMAGACGLGGSC
jgi:hypothetical protein